MAEGLTSAPVATDYTLEFVRSHLPDGARAILEIGCGAGELAARIHEAGMTVVAVDSEASCVEAACRKGVDARVLSWPATIDGRFDAVLFTRSLHHVHDLEGGLDAAERVLRPGGRIIVEDSGIEGTSEGSDRWYTGLTRTLAAAGAFTDGFDLDHALAKIDIGDHVHELHSSTVIEAALRRFAHVQAEDSAYYFRYLEPDLRGGAGAARALLDHELGLMATGAIDPLGRRFVAVP